MDANVFMRIFGGITPSANGRSGVVNNPIMFCFSASLVLGTALLFLRGHKRGSLDLLNNQWLTSLYVWSLFSVLWSPTPSMVVRGGLGNWSFLLCGVIASQMIEAEEAVNLVCDVVFMLALLSIFFQLVFPLRQTMAPGWTGVYGEKNHLGIGMGVGCIAQFASARRWSAWRIVQLGTLLAILGLSQSTTSMIFVFVTAFLFVIGRLPVRLRSLAATGVIGSVVLSFAFISHLTERLFDAAGKNTNFTGRDVIWRFTLDQWAKRPVFGYGLYSFWESEDTLCRQWLGWNPGEAHNGFLEIGVTLGIVGVVLLLGTIISGFFLILRARRAGHHTAALWLGLSWVAVMIDNLTEADFLIPGPLWFIYCLVYFITYAELRRAALPQRVAVPLPSSTSQSSFAPAKAHALLGTL